MDAQPSEHEKNTQPSETKKKRIVKVDWKKRTTLILCDVCIQVVQKGMRPGTQFSPDGWIFVVNNFNEASGKKYNKGQLKNKWDQLKKDWKLWNDLIGKETGLDWDPKNQTIDATDEWWDQKLKVVPAASRFRKEGHEPELVDRLDIMFCDIVATGVYAKVPSITIQIDDENANDNVYVLSEEGNIDKESGDSTEEDFEKSIDKVMQNSTEYVETSIRNRNKRKIGKIRGKGKNVRKKMGGATKLREDISRLVASVKSRSNSLSTTPFSTLMEDVVSLPGINRKSELFYFASYIFEQRAKRDSHSIMEDPEEKLGWLNFQYEMIRGKKPSN